MAVTELHLQPLKLALPYPYTLTPIAALLAHTLLLP